MRHIVVVLLLTGCCAFGQHAGGRGPAVHGGSVHPVHPYRGGTVVVPYPAYMGGGYYPGYVAPSAGYAYGYDPSYGAYPPSAGYGSGYAAPGYGDPSQQSPVVVVNPNYRPDTVHPVLRDYSNTPLPPPGPAYLNASQPLPDPPATIYLIAMKDHTIFPTVAYWVEGDTLNYVTSEGVRNRASLALVDRDFSKQLNDERNVEFKLPPAK